MKLLILAALLTMSPPLTYASNNTDIVGTVPRLLTAIIEQNSRYQECTLGNAVSDAMRVYLNSDIAIICGGDLISNIPPGDITLAGIKSVFLEDRTLALADITYAELSGILEAGLSYITLDESERIDSSKSVYDGFPQVSGFVLYYDAAAPPGQRVYEIRIEGNRIDLNDDVHTVTLAATAHMLEGGYGLPSVGTKTVSDQTLSSVTARYIYDGMADYQQGDSRINPMGANSGGLISQIPTGIIFVVALLFLSARLGRRKNRSKDDLLKFD